MDLASRCAALFYLLGVGRRRGPGAARHDPADMGTAFGLEASLAPPLSESSEDDGDLDFPDSAAWLRPR